MTIEAGPRFEDVAVGDELPSYELAITVQRLVMEAGSNRDFAPIHHDREAGRAAGAPDMFANTDFVEMLLEVALRRWMGLGGGLERLRYRIVDFNVPGDLVRVSGRVIALEPLEPGEAAVAVEAVGRATVELTCEATRDGTVRGVTVRGEATVSLPPRRT